MREFDILFPDASTSPVFF